MTSGETGKWGNVLSQKSHHAPGPVRGNDALVGESAENGKRALQVLSLCLSQNSDCANANVCVCGGRVGGARDTHYKGRGMRCLALMSLLRSLLVRVKPVPVLYRSLSHCCCLWNRLEVSQHGRGRQDGEVWSWWQAVSIRQQLWHLLLSELDSVCELPQCLLQRNGLNQTATVNTTFLSFYQPVPLSKEELLLCHRKYNSGARGTEYLLRQKERIRVVLPQAQLIWGQCWPLLLGYVWN